MDRIARALVDQLMLFFPIRGGRYRFAGGRSRESTRYRNPPRVLLAPSFSPLSLHFSCACPSSSSCRRERIPRAVTSARLRTREERREPPHAFAPRARGISNTVRYFRILRNYERGRSRPYVHAGSSLHSHGEEIVSACARLTLLNPSVVECTELHHDHAYVIPLRR